MSKANSYTLNNTLLLDAAMQAGSHPRDQEALKSLAQLVDILQNDADVDPDTWCAARDVRDLTQQLLKKLNILATWSQNGYR